MVLRENVRRPGVSTLTVGGNPPLHETTVTHSSCQQQRSRLLGGGMSVSASCLKDDVHQARITYDFGNAGWQMERTKRGIREGCRPCVAVLNAVHDLSSLHLHQVLVAAGHDIRRPGAGHAGGGASVRSSRGERERQSGDLAAAAQ